MYAQFTGKGRTQKSCWDLNPGAKSEGTNGATFWSSRNCAIYASTTCLTTSTQLQGRQNTIVYEIATTNKTTVFRKAAFCFKSDSRANSKTESWINPSTIPFPKRSHPWAKTHRLKNRQLASALLPQQTNQLEWSHRFRRKCAGDQTVQSSSPNRKVKSQRRYPSTSWFCSGSPSEARRTVDTAECQLWSELTNSKQAQKGVWKQQTKGIFDCELKAYNETVSIEIGLSLWCL